MINNIKITFLDFLVNFACESKVMSLSSRYPESLMAWENSPRQ